MQGVEISQLHISEAGVQSPAGRIFAGFCALPLESSSLPMGDVLALYVQHITIKGVRLSRYEVAASLGRADVPWGHSSVESIPVCEVLLLGNKIRPGSSDHYALIMMTFVVGSTQTPLIDHFVGVQPGLFAYLITHVAHMLFPLSNGFDGVLLTVLEP